MRVNQNKRKSSNSQTKVKRKSNGSQAEVKRKSNVHTIEQFIGSIKRKINGLFDVYLST
jgi:hypothetical protein